ncbi:Uncharacterized protein QTN25_001500 [Entamoeba marina]
MSSQSETQDSCDLVMKPRLPEDKAGETKQNNALLFLILKEGYILNLPKSKKENHFFKCNIISNSEERIDQEGILQLGKEFDEMVKIKISKNGNDKEIILEPKDIFDDGFGVENESINVPEKKENLPSPFS